MPKLQEAPKLRKNIPAQVAIPGVCPWCGEPEDKNFFAAEIERRFFCGSTFRFKVAKFFPSLGCQHKRVEQGVALIREAMDYNGEGFLLKSLA